MKLKILNIDATISSDERFWNALEIGIALDSTERFYAQGGNSPEANEQYALGPDHTQYMIGTIKLTVPLALF
ncbi:MAG: hypothetical protein IJT66_01085 [Clostridia bacterium]|nr:hypothetical protein [Clostridia bacterium]